MRITEGTEAEQVPFYRVDDLSKEDVPAFVNWLRETTKLPERMILFVKGHVARFDSIGDRFQWLQAFNIGRSIQNEKE